MKVEASDVYPCLISGLDNCIKLDLIRCNLSSLTVERVTYSSMMMRFVCHYVIFTFVLISTVGREKNGI